MWGLVSILTVFFFSCGQLGARPIFVHVFFEGTGEGREAKNKNKKYFQGKVTNFHMMKIRLKKTNLFNNYLFLTNGYCSLPVSITSTGSSQPSPPHPLGEGGTRRKNYPGKMKPGRKLHPHIFFPSKIKKKVFFIKRRRKIS